MMCRTVERWVMWRPPSPPDRTVGPVERQMPGALWRTLITGRVLVISVVVAACAALASCAPRRTPLNPASLPAYKGPPDITVVPLASDYLPILDGSQVPIGLGIKTVGGSRGSQCVVPADANGTVIAMRPATSLARYAVSGSSGEGQHEAATLVASPTDSSTGQVTIRFDELSSYDSLRVFTNLSAAASFNIGVYSGGGSSAYLSSHDYSQFRRYLMLYVRAKAPSEMPPTWRLTRDAQAALHRGAQAFYNLCGDAFVSQVYTGGELSDIWSYSAQTESEANSISTTIQAARQDFASAGGGFTKTMNKYSSLLSGHETRVSVGPLRGSVSGLSQSTLLAYADTFAQRAVRDGYVLGVRLSQYDIVPSINPKDVPDYQKQRRYLEQLATLYDVLQSQRADLDEAAHHSSYFDLAALNIPAASDTTAADITRILGLVDVCTRTPGKCTMERVTVHLFPIHRASSSIFGTYNISVQGWDCFATVTDSVDATLILGGRWIAGGGIPPYTPEQSTRVRFEDAQTSGRLLPPGEQMYAGPLKLPSRRNYRVCVTVNDYPWAMGDNIPDPGAPLNATIREDH